VTNQDYFSFFGLEPKLKLDGARLQRRFYELSRQYHPDRFATQSADLRREAEEKTALLNDAFRTLKDPVERAEYVLDRHSLAPDSTAGHPELLEEVFELNMALDELKTGDESVKPQLIEAQEKFTGMLKEINGQLERHFDKWDESGDAEQLKQIRKVLNRRKYIQNLAGTVSRALAG
jgi:molecular chaperone HscB